MLIIYAWPISVLDGRYSIGMEREIGGLTRKDKKVYLLNIGPWLYLINKCVGIAQYCL